MHAIFVFVIDFRPGRRIIRVSAQLLRSPFPGFRHGQGNGFSRLNGKSIVGIINIGVHTRGSVLKKSNGHWRAICIFQNQFIRATTIYHTGLPARCIFSFRRGGIRAFRRIRIVIGRIRRIWILRVYRSLVLRVSGCIFRLSVTGCRRVVTRAFR